MDYNHTVSVYQFFLKTKSEHLLDLIGMMFFYFVNIGGIVIYLTISHLAAFAPHHDYVSSMEITMYLGHPFWKQALSHLNEGFSSAGINLDPCIFLNLRFEPFFLACQAIYGGRKKVAWGADS